MTGIGTASDARGTRDKFQERKWRLMEMQENRRTRTVGGAQDHGPDESMEDWFNLGVSDIQEGEVVRGPGDARV